ncbi:MAG: twin-arginine translocation signal domain-containing protein [Deltaproteobacteria bacterium]
MSERNQGMSRRSLLKGVAASGVVVAVGGLVPES